MIEVLLHRVFRHGLTAAGAEVAGNADFDWHLTLGEFLKKVRVLRGGQAVADALGAKVDRSLN